MSSPESLTDDVTVIFRKNDSIIVPPFGLPREKRRSGETFETTLHRLTDDHGVVGYVDYAISTWGLEGSPQRAYLMQPRNGELDSSEFFIPKNEVIAHVEAHERLSDMDKELFKRAVYLLG